MGLEASPNSGYWAQGVGILEDHNLCPLAALVCSAVVYPRLQVAHNANDGLTAGEDARVPLRVGGRAEELASAPMCGRGGQ